MQNFDEFIEWLVAVIAIVCMMCIGKFLVEWAICLYPLLMH
jgi:hypothetical protein